MTAPIVRPGLAIPPLPAPLHFVHDQIDLDVLELVEREFSRHSGSLDNFRWGTTRSNALLALEHFITHSLPHFGDYQDAMVQGADMLFHSLLSPYLNCGLLRLCCTNLSVKAFLAI